MTGEPLDGAGWRCLRLWLTELDDAGLDGVFEQLDAEIGARQARERDIMRLFFSSLPAEDLEWARREVIRERAERVQDEAACVEARKQRSSLRSETDQRRPANIALSPDAEIARCSPMQTSEQLTCVEGASGVMDVVTAETTAKGDFTMTMSSSSEQGLPPAALDEGQTGAVRKSTRWPGRAGRRKAGTKQPRKASTAKKPAKRAGKRKRTKADGVREGSKTATVLTLLQKAKGATLAELMEATGWQAHSVRGFISGVVGRKMGLKVASVRRDNGERVYSIPK